MAVNRKKKTSQAEALGLSVLARKIQEGELTAIPEALTIDLKNASAGDYQALLELVRFQSFGHRVLKTMPELPAIQKLRTLMNEGKFTEALENIEGLDLSEPEVAIEKARALVFLGNLADVESLLTPVVEALKVPATQRGVAAQLLGHALLELGKIPLAEECFQKAKELAEFAGNTLGKVSAHLFLSKVCGFHGKAAAGEFFLSKAYEDLKKTSKSPVDARILPPFDAFSFSRG